jgi:hypothetical protein
MNIVAQFLEDLSKLIATHTRAANIDGIVYDEPDETKFTCTVQIPTTEALIYNVPLRVLISSQSSFIEIPKKGTACVLTFRDMNESRPQILEVHECKKIIFKCDSIIFNDGTNDGFVLVAKLVSAYNNVVNDIGTIKTALNTNCANGVPLIVPGTWTPETTTKANTDFANPNIKQ